jgi:hypothetical protein
MLVAKLIPASVLGVVTYGAPLDTSAWADFHGYTQLSGSVNPAERPEHFERICQLHLFGDRDKEVPTELIATWKWPMQRTVINLPATHGNYWKEPLFAAVTKQVVGCAEAASLNLNRPD